MHELGLMQNILEIAEVHARREGARAIREIGLKVGALSGVEKAALEFAFEALKSDTLAHGARLEVRWLPLRAHCPECRIDFESENRSGVAVCPACNQATAAIKQGQELEVEYLDVD
ncbi:hydrogenase maturation nickel metallochaperone HypA [uncultured Meiothermus sp.]|jgi:hydrogenase nickel incorporation protein HypA/HybF|uniref:hydrogenase maturation nickel metallochaperone HypA n=1 Tax=uncultured Meiothermus sp. TaxID=157471 RepID=UPI002634E589|nr:hydrogenase maturation nickel metallochaperone HypA [uncultured Meiothermus sp.]